MSGIASPNRHPRELIVVDGTFELYRAFYGAPPKVDAAGREVGASLGVVRSLLSLVRERTATHVAVAFDSVIESFRNDLYPGYKTGDGIDPALFSQFPLVERLVDAVGFAVFGMREFEADDALATLARRFEHEVERVVVASPDKDLCQVVVAERIVTWDRLRQRTFDEAGVLSRLGVLPRSVPDYLALVGDVADGIPGVKRWGAKSAALVLGVHPHLEDVLARGENFGVPVRGARALAASLRGSFEDAILFRELATLRRDVPLEVTLEDLRVRAADAEKLGVLESELGLDLSPFLQKRA